MRRVAAPERVALRRHALWALGFEATFFVATLAIGTAVAALPESSATARSLNVFVRSLRHEFAPVTSIHAWPHLALAIFGHNLELMLPILLLGMLAMWLAARGGTFAGFFAAIDLIGALLFLAENTIAAGLLVGYISRLDRLPTVRVFASLLPHGIFEIFALSWAFAQPAVLIYGLMNGQALVEVGRENRPGMVRGAVYSVLILALAATIESTLSPVVTRALIRVPQVRTASASISTCPPFGSALTPTVTRAGRVSPRARAYASFTCANVAISVR